MDIRSTLRRFALAFLLSLTTARLVSAQAPDRTTPPIDDRAISRALCPIVYKVDDSPSSRGYHYLFYGNAFFINKSGYLLTAAHVLSQLHGGQPFLLIRGAAAPPHFVQATVVAIDRDHDVALLLATPNPFDSNATVEALPIGVERAKEREKIVLAAERPFKPRDAYTLDPSLEERSPGSVLGFEFSQLDRGRAETELFLFDHAVRPGQSGGPVLSLDSHEVVGIVEGQWLRDDSLGFAATAAHTSTTTTGTLVPGAVIPIHYALAILQRKGIEWNSEETNENVGGNASDTGDSPLPEPLSFVAAPFPSQSLFGGEVMLDAAVACNGTLTDLKVVHGDPPFLQDVLDAVRTWTYRQRCESADSRSHRIAIIFQFPQPYIPPRAPTVHHYDGDTVPPPGDLSARVVTTIEPGYPQGSDVEGSVIIEETVDRDGKVGSIKFVRELDPLTAAARDAVGKWRFVPARQSGVAVDSEAIVVVTFRRPAETPRQ